MPSLEPLSALSATELLVGALFGPLAGYLGTRIKNSLASRDIEEKRRKLVADTGRLIEFSNLLARTTGASPIHDEFARAQSTIQATLSKKLSEIAGEFPPEHSVASHAGGRSFSERVFLTYRPRRPWLWMLHLFYYALMGSFILSSFGLWLDRAEPGTAEGALALCVVFALPGIIVNLLANRSDRISTAGQPPSHQGSPVEPAPKRSAVQRIFLLYRPRRRRRWALHLLFYYVLIWAPAAPFVLGEDRDDAAFYAVTAILAVSLNLIANRCDKSFRAGSGKPMASSSTVSTAPST